MFRSKLLLGIAVCGIAFAAAAGPAASPEQLDFRREADLLFRDFAKAPPSDADVGDANSFGRNVKWLGLIQTGQVTLTSDCTGAPSGPDDRCVLLNAAPAPTTFDLPDIGRMTLPPRSSHSLLCHWLTPIAFYQFHNTTAANANANIRLSPYIIVESDVLDDPLLIDPSTGLPFGGQLESGFAATLADARTLEPGERASMRFGHSRDCIAGFLSKRNLIEGYGLTDAQATQIFRREITLRFGLRGSAAVVGDAFVLYGLRVMGD
jgi:hypothetical protein